MPREIDKQKCLPVIPTAMPPATSAQTLIRKHIIRSVNIVMETGSMRKNYQNLKKKNVLVATEMEWYMVENVDTVVERNIVFNIIRRWYVIVTIIPKSLRNSWLNRKMKIKL